MNDDDKLTLILSIIAALVIAATVYFLCRQGWRDTAVQEGHAEYYLDANHDRQWRWKTNCCQTAETTGGKL